MTALKVFIGVVVLAVIVLVNTVVVMYCERKWLGHMQSRLGPMRTGYHGLLQPIADAIKLLGKEDLMPASADRILFLIAPILAFVPAILVYAAMPWVDRFAGASFDVGIFFVFAIAALSPVGVLLAGWASANKYSVIGGFRAAAQQISYEVPMILSTVGVVMLAGSMRLSTIVSAQSHVWNIVTQPLAFILFFIGILAEVNRTPFDIPEAESELVAGFNVEYSSMRFALFFVAEYMNVFTVSLLATLLFLGGWGGPVLPDIVWLLIKTYAMVFTIIWVRATFPRFRTDQLMVFSWKVLIPAALVNLMLAALGVVTNLFVLTAVEFAAAALFVWLVAKLGRTAGDKVRAAAEAGEVAA
ncbi:MAG TPA: NADH-quinone oxidoreductase subunit NuoH [Coriobacteriia bacterium]